MVEINNQLVKAFTRYAGVVPERLITDVRRAGNHGYDVIVGGGYLLITPITSQTCHAKPKTQINRRRTHQLLSVGGMPTASSQKPERLLSKSQDAVALQQIKGA